MLIRTRRRPIWARYKLAIRCAKCGVVRGGQIEADIPSRCRCGSGVGAVVVGRFAPWGATAEERADGEARVAALKARWRADVHTVRRPMLLKSRRSIEMAKVLKVPVKATKVAVTVPVGKVKKVKDGKPKTGPVASRMVGKTSGLTVLKYQNLTLEQNRKKRMTDEQLAAMWCKEHPESKAVQNGNIDAAMVRAVRNSYNLGKHGNNDGVEIPNPIPQFDESGQPMPAHGEKTAAKREAQVQKKTIERVKKGTPAPVVKKLKKVK